MLAAVLSQQITAKIRNTAKVTLQGCSRRSCTAAAAVQLPPEPRAQSEFCGTAKIHSSGKLPGRRTPPCGSYEAGSLLRRSQLPGRFEVISAILELGEAFVRHLNVGNTSKATEVLPKGPTTAAYH